MGKLRNLGLIALGAVAGVLVSLNFQAIADRATRDRVEAGLVRPADHTLSH